MDTLSTRSNKIRKTYRLNQELIDHVRRILGVKTETEAIEKALEQIRFKTDLKKWIDRTSASYPEL